MRSSIRHLAQHALNAAAVLASVLLGVSLDPSVATAETAWVHLVEVPPSPFEGNTYAVRADFYGEEGAFFCESFCYYYDDKVDPSTFVLAVNGGYRDMNVVETNSYCEGFDEYGNYVCHWWYSATGTPALYFNGRINTITAQVNTWGLAYWYAIGDSYQYYTPPTIEVIAGKPVTTVDKDACLAIGILSDVATQCGVLRITHTLPAVRTFNKTRAPTLIYYHDQVRLWAPLQVNVRAAVGEQVPESVSLRITDPAGAQLVTKKIGGPFSTSTARRVGLLFALDPNRATGLLPYTMTAAYKRNGVWESPYVTIADEMVIVNRRQSGMGAGWSVVGVERLYPGQTGGRILWIGGDGSSRIYSPTQSNPALYRAAAVDRPDSLLWSASSSTYTRYLPHGATVVFDNAGRHTRTVTRLGHTTQFVYRTDSITLLDQIIVPGGLLYQLSYTGGALTSITAPGVGSGRVTTIRRQGGAIRAIIDPNVVAGRTDSVSFDFFTGTDVVRGRTDRRGTRTEFTLESDASTLASASTPLGGGQYVTHTFRTSQALSMGATDLPVAVEDAYTRYDAPRTDVGDVTKLWVNGLGAPTKIQNAAGSITRIVFDTTWPGLPVRVETPSGYVTTAQYTARGNLDSTTSFNAYGDGNNEGAKFEWDTKWDFVTHSAIKRSSTRGPGERHARFSYDAATGNRLWEEPEADWYSSQTPSTSRINYEYYTSGAAMGLLKTVALPGNIRDSVAYDALGNLSLTKTPLGWQSWLQSDAIGRLAVTRTQMENSLESHDSVFYDALGQATRAVSHGPVRNVGQGQSSAIQAIVAESFYNAEGNLDSLRRSARPDAASIGVLTTRWSYDAIGRRIAETSPDNKIDSTGYDLAGNVVRSRDRRGFVVTMSYDSVNRLVRREVPSVTYSARVNQGIGGIPLKDIGCCISYPWYGTENMTGPPAAPMGDLTIGGDTATFGYDVSGNMTRADNRDARIRRTYYPNGALKTDTLKTLSWSTRDSTKHVYGLENKYGLGGFRTKLMHPRQLAPRTANGILDSVNFEPDARGGLYKVWDLLGNWFEFSRNDRYELVQERYDGDIGRRMTYDADGRLVRDTVSNYSISAYRNPAQVIRATTLTYVDATHVANAYNALGLQDSVTLWYSGLGQLARMEYRQPVRSAYGNAARIYSGQLLKLDALGNRFETRDSSNLRERVWLQDPLTPPNGQSLVSTTLSNYAAQAGQPATGRLRTTYLYNRQEESEYDVAGNSVFQYTTNPIDPVSTPLHDQVSFYGGDGKLRAVEVRTMDRRTGYPSESWSWWMTFDEFRYDALGRRVMVRTRRQCRDNSSLSADLRHPCNLGTIRRTIWDGAAELYEIQRPGSQWDSDATMDNDTLPTLLDPWPGGPTYFDPNPRYGVVAYTYGLALDRPVSVTRTQYVHQPYNTTRYVFPPFAAVPHWDWRGTAGYGTIADGGWGSAGVHDGADRVCRPGGSNCITIGWRQRSMAFTQTLPTDGGWNGTLIQDKEDATGLLYRRNRYVDANTGRFTQEDPIGLAGGANLYGYANANPISFGDPFGLCPYPTGRGPWGSLFCWFEDVRTGANQAAIAAANAIERRLKESLQKTAECAPLCLIIAASGPIGEVGGGASVAGRIGGGHAFEKHVLARGEFQGLGIRTVRQMQGFVADVMRNAEGANIRALSRGRTAYWDEATGTIVIHDPRSVDQGTVFRPSNGRAYFESAK